MMDRNDTVPLVLIASGVAGPRKRWRQAIQGLFADRLARLTMPGTASWG